MAGASGLSWEPRPEQSTSLPRSVTLAGRPMHFKLLLDTHKFRFWLFAPSAGSEDTAGFSTVSLCPDTPLRRAEQPRLANQLSRVQGSGSVCWTGASKNRVAAAKVTLDLCVLRSLQQHTHTWCLPSLFPGLSHTLADSSMKQSHQLKPGSSSASSSSCCFCHCALPLVVLHVCVCVCLFFCSSIASYLDRMSNSSFVGHDVVSWVLASLLASLQDRWSVCRGFVDILALADAGGCSSWRNRAG